MAADPTADPRSRRPSAAAPHFTDVPRKLRKGKDGAEIEAPNSSAAQRFSPPLAAGVSGSTHPPPPLVPGLPPTFQGQGGENGVLGGRTPHVLQDLLHRGGRWASGQYHPLLGLGTHPWRREKRQLSGASPSRRFPGPFLRPVNSSYTPIRAPCPGKPTLPRPAGLASPLARPTTDNLGPGVSASDSIPASVSPLMPRKHYRLTRAPALSRRPRRQPTSASGRSPAPPSRHVTRTSSLLRHLPAACQEATPPLKGAAPLKVLNGLTGPGKYVTSTSPARQAWKSMGWAGGPVPAPLAA